MQHDTPHNHEKDHTKEGHEHKNSNPDHNASEMKHHEARAHNDDSSQTPNAFENPPYRKKTGISTQAAILLGAIFISVAVLAHGFITPKNSGGSLAYLDTFIAKAPGTDAFIEGKKDNKVYFVEYSDSQCPYCTAFHKTTKEIRAKYAGKITFIYRHFPLTQIHSDALPEAIKMNCVGKLKGEKSYYDFMTKLFDYKDEKQVSKLPDDYIASYLQTAGITQTDFTKCIQDPAVTAEVQASIQDGVQAGVNGTPTSFILIKDGDEFKIIKRLEGASQSSFVIPLIEKALKS